MQLKWKREAGAGLGPTVGDVGFYAVVAICLFAGLLLFYRFLYPVHQDLAGSVLSGRLALTLGDAFRDYSIYFPPAEKFWFSFAARLSDWTGLRLDLAIASMTGAMVLFGVGLAYEIRRKTVGASPLFLALSVAALIALPILFKNVFGLREHLVALGLWPYLVFRISDPGGQKIGWRLRLLLGLWMGATLLFKYLYSVVVLLVELADVLAQRRVFLLLRIENIVAGTSVFLYLFSWLGLDPSQREAIAAMISAIDANLKGSGESLLRIAESFFFGIVLLIISRIFRVPPRQVAIALAVLLGTVIAAWAQGRWYTHHLFPITLAYIFWWWAAAPHFRLWAHAAIAAYLLFATTMQFANTASYHQRLAELDRALENAGESVSGKRVAILTLHPSPYSEYLASHDGLRWDPMANNAYVSAELKSFDRKENQGKPTPPVALVDPGRRMLHDQMLRLWEDIPPDALILDYTYRWPLDYIGADWIGAFSQDPRFNAIMRHYRPVYEHRGTNLRFTYYVRAD